MDDPKTIVKYTLNHHIFNASVNAIYLVLVTPDVTFTAKGLDAACGYHSAFLRNEQLIKFAVVGDKESGCTYGGTHLATGLLANTLSGDSQSPSGNTVADRYVAERAFHFVCSQRIAAS